MPAGRTACQRNFRTCTREMRQAVQRRRDGADTTGAVTLPDVKVAAVDQHAAMLQIVDVGVLGMQERLLVAWGQIIHLRFLCSVG